MTRKEKRELRKDKLLVCSLYNIINKYLPKLFTMLEKLTDKRQSIDTISKITNTKLDNLPNYDTINDDLDIRVNFN